MGAYCCPFVSSSNKPDYIFLEDQTNCVESKEQNSSSSNYNKKDTQSKADQYNNEVFQQYIFSNYAASQVSSEDTSSNESVDENSISESSYEKEPSNKLLNSISNHDGAYLIYNSTSNGSLITCWSTSSVPNALMFAQRKPNLFIPSFRYRQKTAFVLFLKSVRAFQNKVVFFNSNDFIFKIPPIYLFLYTDQNKVSVLSPENETENLMETKMIAACFFSEKCVHDFTLLKNKAFVEFEDFQRLCVKYSDILCTTLLK